MPGIYTNLSPQRYNVHYAVRDGKWGKRESPSPRKESPAGDIVRSVVCEKRLVFRLETENVLCVKAQQQA